MQHPLSFKAGIENAQIQKNARKHKKMLIRVQLFRLLSLSPSSAQLLLSQDTTLMAMDTAMVVMVIMDMGMARERLMLLLKLMLSQDITLIAMDTAMEDMDTMAMVMARERLNPPL